MSIIKEIKIKLEVHEDKTIILCDRFFNDTVRGPNHEQKAREIIPMLLNQLDFMECKERLHKKHGLRKALLRLVK